MNYVDVLRGKKKYLSRLLLIHTVCVLWMQVKLIDETNLTVIFFIFWDDLGPVQTANFSWAEPNT